MKLLGLWLHLSFDNETCMQLRMAEDVLPHLANGICRKTVSTLPVKEIVYTARESHVFARKNLPCSPLHQFLTHSISHIWPRSYIVKCRSLAAAEAQSVDV